MFEGRLREIQVLQTQGLNAQIVKECSTIIEQILEKFYEDIWRYINSDEKQDIINTERKYSRKVNPVDRLGMGNWIKFYEESHLAKLISKYLKIDDLAFDFVELTKINEIRNKCTHEGYVASKEEAKIAYDSTVKLLIKTRLIEKEPLGIRPIREAEKKETSIYHVWGDKIRLFLAGNPIFEIEEPFEEDMGKSYYVSGKWEFVGVVVAGDKIHILLLEDSSSCYHEDIIDDVYKRLAMMIKEKIQRNYPELSGINTEINIAFDMGDWGEAYEDIKF